MRICFVSTLYSHKTQRGGLGEHIADLSQALARQGHDVTVITSGPPGESREGNVTIVQLGRVEPFSRPSQLLRPAYVFSRLGYMLRLRRHVSAGRFDVVEAADGGFEQFFLLWWRTTAIVTKLHGNFRQIHSERWLLTRLVSALERAAVRRSDAVYASTSLHARIAHEDYRMPGDAIAVIPCGINLAELAGAVEPSEVDRRFPQLRCLRLVLLSVGMSPERKGARLFIDAARAREWTDVAFVLICADASFAARCEIPPGVIVIPQQEKRVFRMLLAAASVVVLPSAFESFSIATHEAMLLGRAVIVSAQIPLDAPARNYPRLIMLDPVNGATLAAATAAMLSAEPTPPQALRETREQLEAAYGIERVTDATVALYRVAIERRANGATAVRA